MRVERFAACLLDRRRLERPELFLLCSTRISVRLVLQVHVIFSLEVGEIYQPSTTFECNF